MRHADQLFAEGLVSFAEGLYSFAEGGVSQDHIMFFVFETQVHAR